MPIIKRKNAEFYSAINPNTKTSSSWKWMTLLILLQKSRMVGGKVRTKFIICDIYRKFFLNFVGFPEYLNFTCTFSEFVFFSDNFYEVSIMLLGNYFVN